MPEPIEIMGPRVIGDACPLPECPLATPFALLEQRTRTQAESLLAIQSSVDRLYWAVLCAMGTLCLALLGTVVALLHK